MHAKVAIYFGYFKSSVAMTMARGGYKWDCELDILNFTLMGEQFGVFC